MGRWDKRRLQVSCVTALLLFLLLVAIRPQLAAEEGYTGAVFRGCRAVPLAGYAAVSVLICCMTAWKGPIHSKSRSRACAVASLALMPAVSFFMFETVAGNFLTIIRNQASWTVLNLCIWYLLYAAAFALCNHVRAAVLLMNTCTYLFAVANAFVVMFREQPIMIMDFKSLTTAASVAGEFSYVPDANMVVMGLLAVLCNLWILKMDFCLADIRLRLGYILVMAAGTWCCLYGMLIGDIFARAGSDRLDFFRFNYTYQEEGYLVCTVKSIRFLRVEEPEGYSEEAVLAAASDAGESKETKRRLPENVIVIMNESFADLSVLGEFRTSEPVLPYVESIADQTRQGNVYVSVFGGGTANTEFEFLTGNSVAFIPAGTIAYQMYVREGASSIVSLFREQGYRTVMWHPFRKDNYNRIAVYDIFGFDEYYGRGDIKFKKLRQYASDRSDYKAIMKIYEQKKPGEKLFLFNITMQNHSGYDDPDYESTISLVDYPGEFPQAEQYLSLMHESDQALQMLIDYFSGVDEDTVILLFGDHQPNLEAGFYERVMEPDTPEHILSNAQKKMVTPYILWANYELWAEEAEAISVNYLGSYFLDAIGMELPAYNRYLQKLRKKIPVINTNGFLDSSGNLYWWGEEGGFSEELNTYRMFVYNNLFDKKNRLRQIFE